MSLKPGMRVRVVRDVRSVFRVCVPAGTLGTVEEVRSYGSVGVRFDNGRTLGVSDTFLTVEATAPEKAET